jgi:hypothetical protein
MQLPDNCPECGAELEYLSEVYLVADTDPQEAGLEGNCFKCGTLVYSKFKMFGIDLTLFDADGNELKNKKYK